MLAQSTIWYLLLGVLSAVAGLTALAVSAFRSKSRDVALLTFGLTAVLYGVRLIVSEEMDALTDVPPPAAAFFAISILSYVIPVPLSGFLLHLFGPGWRNSMRWAFRGAVAFCLLGVVTDLITGDPFSLERLNNALVILWAMVVMANAAVVVRTRTREISVILGGFLIFGILAVNNNLVSLGAVPWTWQGEELGFVAFLGAIGTVAITRFFTSESRLQMLDREMEIARQIQMSILPRSLPKIAGLSMAARYVPMRSVAGDFYDVIVEGDRRVGILVADVSGHGVGAALIASMLKVAFAAQAQQISRPAAVLAGINRALQGKLDEHFITAAYIYIDMRSKELRYALAGHPPIVLYRKQDTSVREYGKGGLMLGPFPDARYREHTVPFRKGDRVVVITDGVLEARDRDGTAFGESEFHRSVISFGQSSVDEQADGLLERLNRWSGNNGRSSLEDDVTLVVVEKGEK